MAASYSEAWKKALEKRALKKAKRAEKRKTLDLGKRIKKPKAKSLSKLKKELWKEISALVRSWSPTCLACKTRPTEVAAHIVPSNEGAATRFFLPNLYPCCIIDNGLEKWNRGSWVKKHEEMFGTDFVNALYDYSKTTFQLKKYWVEEQIERIRALRKISLDIS